MNEIPNSFEFKGLACYTKPGVTNSYYYVPLQADLQRSSGGPPMFNLIAMGAKGYLMLTVVWGASVDAVDALRGELARRNNINDPSLIKLEPAPARVTRCNLLLGDGAGTFSVLGSNPTSGMPPYSAVFSVSLNEDQFVAVAAAANGRAGFLAIEYEVSLTTQVAGHARLTSRSARFVPWLRDYVTAGPEGLRNALEEAIVDDLAAIEVALPVHAPAGLAGDLYESVLDRAVTVLPGLIDRWDPNADGDLSVEAQSVVEVSQPLRPRLDLATRIVDPAAIKLTGGTTPAIERAARPGGSGGRGLGIRFGFDSGDAPLAWVRVRRGNAETVLRPPAFSAVQLPDDGSGQPVALTAGYTNGASVYRQELDPAGGELVLQPDDVGLKLLTIDARPLSAAGARAAEISLRYRPPNRGDEQRATIQLNEDTAWLAHWWVAANTPAWLRYVDYNWKTEIGEGRIAGQSTSQTGSSEITLSLGGGASLVTSR
jgi:hypothetical protein